MCAVAPLVPRRAAAAISAATNSDTATAVNTAATTAAIADATTAVTVCTTAAVTVTVLPRPVDGATSTAITASAPLTLIAGCVSHCHIAATL